MLAEKTECDRWSYADLDDKFLQKFEVCHFVPASGAHRSRRLMSCFSLLINVHAQNVRTQKFLLRKFYEIFNTGMVKKLKIIQYGAKKLSLKSVLLSFE